MNQSSISPKIKNINPKKIIGVYGIGNSENLSNYVDELWNQFFDLQYDNLQSHTIYEIYEPSSLNSNYSYYPISIIVGVETHDFNQIIEGLICKICTGGKYAIFSFEDELEKLSEFYEKIQKEWLPNSNYEWDDRDEYFEYILDPHNQIPKRVNIYIPIF